MAKSLGILVWKRCRKVEHQWKENVVSIFGWELLEFI